MAHRARCDHGVTPALNGECVIDLPTEKLPVGARIDFTFYWSEVDRWEHTDFFVVIDQRLEARG